MAQLKSQETRRVRERYAWKLSLPEGMEEEYHEERAGSLEEFRREVEV